MSAVPATTTVGSLQNYLSRVYELDMACRVEDFLFTDENLAHRLEGEHFRATGEKLLIHESADELELSVYFDAAMLVRLDASTPLVSIAAADLRDFWTALEGVSHFLYLAWNAHYDRSVRGVELELQAEVDKYVITTMLVEEQQQAAAADIHTLLFERTQFDSGLADALLARYRDANRSAAKYCLSLARRFQPPHHPGRVRELRRFYRLDHCAKLHFIEQQH